MPHCSFQIADDQSQLTPPSVCSNSETVVYQRTTKLEDQRRHRNVLFQFWFGFRRYLLLGHLSTSHPGKAYPAAEFRPRVSLLWGCRTSSSPLGLLCLFIPPESSARSGRYRCSAIHVCRRRLEALSAVDAAALSPAVTSPEGAGALRGLLSPNTELLASDARPHMSEATCAYKGWTRAFTLCQAEESLKEMENRCGEWRFSQRLLCCYWSFKEECRRMCVVSASIAFQHSYKSSCEKVRSGISSSNLCYLKKPHAVSLMPTWGSTPESLC